jgi:hypothetical protein
LTSCDFHNQWLYLGELFLYDGFLNKLLICLFIICILIVCHQHNNNHAVGHWDDLLLRLAHEVNYSSCLSDLSINSTSMCEVFLEISPKGFWKLLCRLKWENLLRRDILYDFLSNEARAIISLNFYSAKRSSHIWGVMRYANIIFFCGSTRMKYNLFCTQISSFLHKMPINWRQKDKG